MALLVALLTFALGAVQASYASPIVGASANTLPRGAFMVDFWASSRDFERAFDTGLYDGGEGGWIDYPEDASLTAASVVPRLCYGVTDWFTLRVSLPIEDRYLNFPDSVGEETNTGMGDIVVDPKIRIYEGDEGYPRLALLTGVRFPTGETEGVDGRGTLALSNGSTGILAGCALTQAMGPHMAHLCASFWFNGESDSGADVKDLLIASATLESPLDEQWSLLWEFKGYWGEDPKAYYRTYACPGISWNGEKMTAGLSAMVSATSYGGGGISYVDFDWAPYLRVYYRFF